MSRHGSPLLTIDIDARRALAHAGGEPASAPFAALADGLAQELAPLIDAPLPIPEHKARLTRFGGRCPEHGTFLDFDPWKPHEHWCARCERPYRHRVHDDWWAMGAQLWTAERAVHAAALYALRGEPRHGALAVRILRECIGRYDTWPNKDNVLGPSRPFFSTYLESIWLLNLCHAVDLLEGGAGEWTAADASAVREHLLEPSASLIASYHEGGSNRQVWNEVAIGSAWLLLGREGDVRRRLDSEGGLRWQIAHGLDDTGSWYEGENYHLFAHRGLWYGVQLMRSLDEPLSAALDARYSAGFVAPFAGLLPDETFPSRRDAQYASSIRQWRTAEWCELGWAHTHDLRIAGILSRVYDGRAPRRDTGRWRSTADAERNTLASSLTRADLSWRALLMAEATTPPSVAMPPESVCLPAQGLAVIRRDSGRTYVALEGGQLGGGHGHPDQLALTLQTDLARWLEDPGTGSYVEAELQWYRSTLAHAAPLINRRSQLPVPARLVAFDDQGEAAWIVKSVDGMADGVRVQRTIVVCDGYLVDVVEWESATLQSFELPIAGRAELIAPVDERFTSQATSEPRGDSLEIFLGTTEVRPLNEPLEMRPCATFADPERSGAAPRASGTEGVPGECAHIWYAVDGEAFSPTESAFLIRSRVPAAPWHGLTDRHWLLARGALGRVVGVWSWPSEEWLLGAVASVRLSPETMPCVRVTTRDGVTATHARVDTGWRIDLDERGAQRALVLAGLRDDQRVIVPERVIPLVTARAVYTVPLVGGLSEDEQPGTPIPDACSIELGESHYVPTEQGWREAGEPTAGVQIAATPEWLVVDVHARTGTLATERPDLMNRLDNEQPDVNADGLQWYFARTEVPPSPAQGWHAAALHVPSPDPETGSQERAYTITGNLEPARVTWRARSDGWAMRLCWSLASLPLDAERAICFELVVNERPPDRERRRGQLVLSGGGGYGYLMGDRRPTDRFVRLVMPSTPAETTLR